jgi:Arm DNA-binding domain
MPLTDIQIRNAKPGLKPIRPQKHEGGKNSHSAATITNGTNLKSGAGHFEKTDKPYKLSDASGLYLEVDPSGGKYWRFKYRFEGKEKRLSLGVYPVVSLADAREARDEYRKQLAKGIDPGIHRKAAKASRVGRVADSFETVAREWYLAPPGVFDIVQLSCQPAHEREVSSVSGASSFCADSGHPAVHHTSGV